MKRAVVAAAFPAWKGKASAGQACRDNVLGCSVFSFRACCHRPALTKQQQGRLENFLRNRKVKKYSAQKTASQGWWRTSRWWIIDLNSGREKNSKTICSSLWQALAPWEMALLTQSESSFQNMTPSLGSRQLLSLGMAAHLPRSAKAEWETCPPPAACLLPGRQLGSLGTGTPHSLVYVEFSKAQLQKKLESDFWMSLQCNVHLLCSMIVSRVK